MPFAEVAAGCVYVTVAVALFVESVTRNEHEPTELSGDQYICHWVNPSKFQFAGHVLFEIVK